MRFTSRMTVLMLMAGLFVAMPTLAQDAPEAKQMTAKAGDADGVQQELAELRQELAAMRAEMKKMEAELAALKKARAPKQRPRRQRPALTLLGKEAPEVTFKTFRDKELSLGGDSDKVKVAFFYASWCGFCKRALPGIEQLNKDYADKPVEVIAINLDSREGRRGKTEAQLIDHYNSLNLTMPMHLDPDKSIGKQYKVSSFPTSFVIGKNGKVEAVHIGGPVGLEKTIAGEIDKLLEGKSLVQADGEQKKTS